MFSCIRGSVQNDIHIALCFTVLFTAYNTQSHIQKTLTVSIQHDNPSYYADGYTCFSIVYAVMSIAFWISPSLIALFGIKMSMILGGLCYLSFVSFCYFEISWLTYLGCAITGFGAALLWTGQATYITLNSEEGKVYNSISIFGILFQISFFPGNLFAYYELNDTAKPISRSVRGQIASTLIVFVLLSLVILSGLKPPLRANKNENQNCSPLKEFKKAFRIATSKNMIICFVAFLYNGMILTHISVIAASVGFSKYLSANSKKFVPLSGVFQGIGEIIGCLFSLYLGGGKILKLGLIPIGGLVNMAAYTIWLVGLPGDSAFTYTNERPLIELSINYILLGNVLIGFADTCLYVEMYNYIGTLFPNDCAPGFAVFKFVRCLGAASSFYYANLISLHWQLLILYVFSLLTIIAYHYATLYTSTINERVQMPNLTTAMEAQHYKADESKCYLVNTTSN